MQLIIDGNNLANMCYHSGKKRGSKPIHNPEGLEVNTIDIFMKMLYLMYDRLYPDSIVICWDKKLTKGVANFRKVECDYKGTRSGDNTLLYQQCDIIEELVSHLGIRNIHPNIMEADDIMAWIAHNATENIIIATFDKDLLQLVSPNVTYYNLRTKELVDINNFESINNIKRTRFLLYKMIFGDRSDNIQGLKGYGKIKSKRLAESETPFKDLSQEQLKLLVRNRKLMDLKIGYTIYPEEALIYQEQFERIPEKNFDKFYAYAMANNIQSIKDYKWKWEDLCLNS